MLLDTFKANGHLFNLVNFWREYISTHQIGVVGSSHPFHGRSVKELN